MTRFLIPFAVLMLSACGGGEAARFLVDAPLVTPDRKVALRVNSIELKDVTLPSHASGPDVLLQAEDGTLVVLGEADWADEPVRAYTDMLARHLDTRSTATVAVEPWPLFERPQSELVVRIDRMLARPDGIFELSAQIAVTSPDRVISDRIQRVFLSTPLPSMDAAGVATASGAAISELADKILAMLAR